MALPTFREDFIPDEPPGKIEAGTFIYENVAGMDAAVSYLAQLGRTLSGKSGTLGQDTPLAEDTKIAMNAIKAYEQTLSLELLRVLKDRKATIYGIDSEARIHERVPTICFNIPNVLPQTVTETMARAGIGIRDGHMYAPRLMQRMGLAKETGMVRVSLVHYNTLAEINRFADVLKTL
jgi:selenocysteine lyase/cysteine desulfurase